MMSYIQKEKLSIEKVIFRSDQAENKNRESNSIGMS